MFGCEHHVGGAEQGVRTGGEDLDVHRRTVCCGGGEQCRRAGGAADPVALHGLDLLRPVQRVEVVEQPVSVGGDPHHPLPQPLPEDREVAALAAPLGGHLFVGQHGAQAGAPVHQRVGVVHQSVRVDDVRPLAFGQLCPSAAVVQCPYAGVEVGDQLRDRPRPVRVVVVPGVVDLQEDPLSPLVELGIGRGEAAPRVVAEPEAAQLTAEVDDVGFRAGARVRAGLDRVLLGGQPKRVEAQRVQHIAAGHPEIARVDIGRDVAQRMADVQSLPGRVREHVLDEHLVVRNGRRVFRCQRPDRVRHVERPRFRPALLPEALEFAGELRGVAKLRHVGVGAGGSGGRGVGHPNRLVSGQVSVELRTGQSSVPALVIPE